VADDAQLEGVAGVDARGVCGDGGSACAHHDDGCCVCVCFVVSLCRGCTYTSQFVFFTCVALHCSSYGSFPWLVWLFAVAREALRLGCRLLAAVELFVCVHNRGRPTNESRHAKQHDRRMPFARTMRAR
jgi:hypothetical protein